ncbi:MAG: hypothetical protein RMJ84_00435 [Sandaracinaceae bacterium]|nr:hypothetical protein [Sandaracinaceae bacterium]
MRELGPLRENPPLPSGKARVFFLAEGDLRGPVHVFDQRGTYYGAIGSGQVLVCDLEPGRYRFYAIRERNGYAVEVPSISQGQVAYIGAADPLFGSLEWRSLNGCDERSKRARQAALRLTRVEKNERAEEVALQELGDVPRRIAEADRDLEQLPPNQRKLRLVEFTEPQDRPCPN